MSDQSLHDTATDLAIPLAGKSRPWRLSAAVAWAIAVGLGTAAPWLAVVLVLRRLPEPIRLDDFVRGDRLEAVSTFTLLGAVAGLLVGAVAGFARGRTDGGRAAFVSGLALAVVCAVGGTLVVLAATVTNLPPEVGSTVVWFLVGATVGGIGYTWTREPSRSLDVGELSDTPWTPSGAVTWGAAVGGFAAAAWLGELAVLKLLPTPFTPESPAWGDVPRLAGLFALAAGGIGLVVGVAFGLVFGAPSRLTAGVARGVGFGAFGAVGGGLFPLAEAATSGWLPPAVSSALTWGVVGGIAAVVAYSWTRRQRSEVSAEAEFHRARRPRLTELHIPGSAGLTASEPAVSTSEPGGWADPDADEPSVLATSGWEPEPVVVTRAAPAPPVPTSRSQRAGAPIRLAPVLMVSVACLLAVGLSAPSPVGWAMLAIGLLGLAVTWALLGQERRIRDLERRLAASEGPEPEA